MGDHNYKISKKDLKRYAKSKYGDCDPQIADYVVVGAGSSSAIMIQNITNDRRNSVIALEWGLDYRDNPKVLFSKVSASLRDVTYNETYISTYNIDAPQQTYSVGRFVGGTSWHASSARRASQQYFDTLAQVAGQRWSYNAVLPFLKALESYVEYPTNTPIISPTRGNSGPIIISQYPASYYNPNPADAALNEQLATIFWSITQENPKPVLDVGGADYNSGQNTYVTSVAGQLWRSFNPTLSPTLGDEFSTTGQFIVAKITDGNGDGTGGRKIKLITAAFADKILFYDNVAIGVEYLRHGKIQRVYAKKKVIISAGTLHSPVLLEQSGIGDPAVLEPIGLKVLRPNVNVGNHMIDDVYYQVAFNVNSPTMNYEGGGRMYMSATGFSYPPFLLAPGAPFFPTSTRTAYGFNSNTKFMQVGALTFSENSSHVSTNNKAAEISVVTNFFTDPRDLELGQIGLRYVKAFTDAAAAQLPELGIAMVYPPPSAFEGPATNLNTYLQNGYVHGDHPVGTCRIATSEAEGVVDGNLHVFGFKSLMVADNSVIPNCVDANSYDLALVIGQVAASIITGKSSSCALP